jgi:hypothetical protein
MDQEQATNRGISMEEPEWEEQVGELVVRAKESIEEYVLEKPHAALGIAAAVGFVLGGGLTPRRLFRLGFAAGGPLLSRQIAQEAFRVVADALQSGSSQAKRGGRRAARAATKGE